MEKFFLLVASLMLAGIRCSHTQGLDYADYVKMDEKLRNDPVFRNTLETINNETVGPHAMHNIDSECFRIFRGYSQSSDQSMAARSLSPWRYVKNYDSRRAPEDRYVLDTACVCRGCFVKTGPSSFAYTESLESRPLPFIRNVRAMDYASVPATVNLGCHCVFPTSNSAASIVDDTEILQFS